MGDDIFYDFSIQNVIRYHGAKGNMLKNTEDMELEDKFDVLVDANDQLLERVVRKVIEIMNPLRTGDTCTVLKVAIITIQVAIVAIISKHKRSGAYFTKHS